MPALLLLGVVLYALVVERLFALFRPGAADRTSPPDDGRRGLLLIRALVAAAPLLGLLGTVSGMISSFDALVDGGRLQEIGRGISHALRTTQYGLTLAIPGLLLERIISRRAASAQLSGAVGREEATP